MFDLLLHSVDVPWCESLFDSLLLLLLVLACGDSMLLAVMVSLSM